MALIKIPAGVIILMLVCVVLLPGCSKHEHESQGAYDPQPIEQGREQNESDERDTPVRISPEVINPDYKGLLNENSELILSGRSIDELVDLIGKPPNVLRQGHRESGWHKEIWILPIYLKDSTGLYIYIQNGEVADWRLDTFVGIGNHPQLLEWFR